MSKVSNLNSDYFYLNVLVPNTGSENILAEYNETRGRPILRDAQDFEMAIERLKIPTSSIPLFVFEDNQYYLGFSLGSDNADPLIQEVVWDQGLNPLPLNSNRFVYFYSNFLDLVNAALSQLWAQALADGNYQAQIPLAIREQKFAPVLQLIQEQSLIELYLPYNNGVQATAFRPTNPAGLNLVMSPKLYHFFSGFASTLISGGLGAGNLSLLRHQFRLGHDMNGFNLVNRGIYRPLSDSADTFIRIQQDYASLFLWQQLTRIIITSTINIQKEFVMEKDDFGQTQSKEILTDFEIEQSNIGIRENIYYYSEKYRKLNFKTNGDLNRFDFKIFFQTRDLKTYQLEIPPNFEVNFKVAFIRRKAYDLKQYSRLGDTKQLLDYV